jgi:alkanesulfonate monooxygenase SsuD/methylene tetrahydromethanopterin reductase-like flavin-dependent oxidoreductase (luciferase family)
VRYGVSIANFGSDISPQRVAELARVAEDSGWDGFFLWDHLLAFAPGSMPLVDPWIALTAAAINTSRIRFGPMVTPLPRRRPTNLARQTASLDQLSGGRLILGVGSGALPYEWEYLGEESNPKSRAMMLDEALEMLTGLWSGEPFAYSGAHYRIGGVPPDTNWQAIFYPPPIQRPRIPIWVAGTWPAKPPFRRAASWDGVCPTTADGTLTPVDVRDMVRYLAVHRTSGEPFDVVIAGETPGDDPPQAGATVEAYEAAGATWWIEGLNPWRFGWTGNGAWPGAAIQARIRQGPPRS